MNLALTPATQATVQLFAGLAAVLLFASAVGAVLKRAGDQPLSTSR